MRMHHKRLIKSLRQRRVKTGRGLSLSQHPFSRATQFGPRQFIVDPGSLLTMRTFEIRGVPVNLSNFKIIGAVAEESDFASADLAISFILKMTVGLDVFDGTPMVFK